MSPSSFKALLITTALGLTTIAHAHVGADFSEHHTQGLIDGLLHPFTGLDHLAAMLAEVRAAIQPGTLPRLLEVRVQAKLHRYGKAA